ncbi:hypothetical protein HNO89_002574 [Sporosarcina luteola]|nr:hypothetical protein [Sporosarcina luteola]
MEKKVLPETAKQNAMPAWKRSLYYVVIAVISIFSILIFLLFLDLLMDEEWILTLLLGGVILFLCWVIIQLIRLPHTSGATKLERIETSTGYVIHALNEWTGEAKTITFHWNQIDDLVIGIWTNPRFKGRKNDYVGSRLIYRYQQDGQIKYADSIILNEKLLNDWINTISRHAIPARVTNANISAVKEQDFDQMLNEVHAVAIEEVPSIINWFMEQEDFTLWHPSSSHQQ